MNWTLIIIIAASLVALGLIAWVTLGILTIRTARKMQAEIAEDFKSFPRGGMSRHFPRDF